MKRKGFWSLFIPGSATENIFPHNIVLEVSYKVARCTLFPLWDSFVEKLVFIEEQDLSPNGENKDNFNFLYSHLWKVKQANAH